MTARGPRKTTESGRIGRLAWLLCGRGMGRRGRDWKEGVFGAKLGSLYLGFELQPHLLPEWDAVMRNADVSHEVSRSVIYIIVNEAQCGKALTLVELLLKHPRPIWRRS